MFNWQWPQQGRGTWGQGMGGFQDQRPWQSTEWQQPPAWGGQFPQGFPPQAVAPPFSGQFPQTGGNLPPMQQPMRTGGNDPAYPMPGLERSPLFDDRMEFMPGLAGRFGQRYYQR